MNSQKGITLTSLVIYITVVLIVVGILAVISGSLQGNIKEIYAEGTNNAEIDKFNIYFLKEVKKQGNAIDPIPEPVNEIIFKTGNKYTFNSTNECIYLNDNIKIAENIENCEFSSYIVNEKTIIKVVIKAVNGEEKTIEYVLTSDKYNFSSEKEDEYINKKVSNEYQQVEYITFQNNNENGYNNCINTLVKYSEADKIEFTYKSNDNNKNLIFIAAYNTNIVDSPFLGNNGVFYTQGFESINTIPENLTREEITDGTKRTISFTYASPSEFNILFGSWKDNTWSRTIDWYSFKIWKGDTMIRDFVPCYRKSDNVAGMYDLLNNTFYTNKGTGSFKAY